MTTLASPCPNGTHGIGRYRRSPTEHDPDCATCKIRDVLAEHDHLHLDPNFVCNEPGIGGVPGSSVRCKCGAFHH